MNAIVMQAELALDAILSEHDDLLDQARGFGMRTAAIPRGLMPLREAQGIVAQFDANTRKLKEFLDSLFTTTRHAPDKATKDALVEIEGRATKALRKFEDDLNKAKDALVRHEDLLVGENFQVMFQALRLAVLDLDLTDKADFTAKTNLYLDATPAYAVGVATVSRTEPREEVYKVRATYKAETDEYVADMWSKRANRWFPAAKKTGHARIPAFVKAVVDKMKAVHDFEGESLFGSRRTVEDTSPEVVKYRGEVDERRRSALVEKGYQEATRKTTEISRAIDQKLRQMFPNGRTETYRIQRVDDNVRTWNSLTLDNSSVQLATTVRVNSTTGAVIPTVWGHYGLQAGKTLPNPVVGNGAVAYIDAAVDAIFKFVLSDPKVVRNLTRKIEDVVSEVRAANPNLSVTPALDGGGQAKDIVVRKYWVSYPGMQRGYFSIQAEKGDRNLDLRVNPLGWDNTDNKFRVPPIKAAATIIAYLKVPNPKTAAQGGRTAGTTRTAGATTFSNLVWISDVGSAFRSVHQEELAEHGHRDGYPGTIAAKSSYTVRAKEPMTQAEASAFAYKDVNNNDKWDRNAFAVPVSKGTVLSTDKVTVTVTARDEREAVRQAKMRIYATGRFPPNADVVVSDLVAQKTAETPRTKTFDVTGTRKAVLTGKIDGWLFYGWAPE